MKRTVPCSASWWLARSRAAPASMAVVKLVAPAVHTEEKTPPKVVNLMDALRQSLDRVSTQKKKPVKVEAEEKPAKAAAPKKKAASR